MSRKWISFDLLMFFFSGQMGHSSGRDYAPEIEFDREEQTIYAKFYLGDEEIERLEEIALTLGFTEKENPQ